MFKIRRQGMAQFQDGLSDGLESVGRHLLARCQAGAPVLTGQVKGSLRLNTEHSREWPRPAVFVSTTSGDGFHIHEGTTDTPSQPWMAQALDGMQRDMLSIIRSETKGR